MKTKAKLKPGFNIGSKWTRFMAVGCSHGKHIDKAAKEIVLAFRERWKPELIVHLGDAIDTAAFRSGARGIDADSSEPVAPDIDGGLQFLAELGADVFLCGNHEARLWHLSHSPNAVISYAASQCVDAIQKACAKRGTLIVPYSGIHQVYKRADVTFTHGTFYNEMAARDYAETYGGKVVFAHTHKAAQQEGRTHAPSTGYCVGTLTRRAALEYASTRRATLSWSHGLVFGEFREGASPQSAVWLSAAAQGEEWRTPL
jgi:hypothetical protein